MHFIKKKLFFIICINSLNCAEIPRIIPIYLVHRPSNDVPYATLEEELLGDFVKYSVKDGKEISLMRRDSEAGQKCCAFQHWVYTQTDGNLLVTDMQGKESTLLPFYHIYYTLWHQQGCCNKKNVDKCSLYVQVWVWNWQMWGLPPVKKGKFRLKRLSKTNKMLMYLNIHKVHII